MIELARLTVLSVLTCLAVCMMAIGHVVEFVIEHKWPFTMALILGSYISMGVWAYMHVEGNREKVLRKVGKSMTTTLEYQDALFLVTEKLKECTVDNAELRRKH